jgi:hypothetical protein
MCVIVIIILIYMFLTILIRLGLLYVNTRATLEGNMV